MTIVAKVIADSISPQGIRLTTLQLRYPRMIHSEFMTHRVFSRNASSSRAIPVERLIQDVLDDPAMPVFWGKNQKGMQAVEEIVGDERVEREHNWLSARDAAVAWARILSARAVHKQLVNRLLEPWCHINVVVTATEWSNFFALRRHPDAQPEMRALADAMWEAREASTPQQLSDHTEDWHLPYIGGDYLNNDQGGWQTMVKLSVARCARVSYLTHEGKPPNVEDDLKLYDRLVGSAPLHASPAEHQATPDYFGLDRYEMERWEHEDEHGNFCGWRQYRKMLPNENVRDR